MSVGAIVLRVMLMEVFPVRLGPTPQLSCMCVQWTVIVGFCNSKVLAINDVRIMFAPATQFILNMSVRVNRDNSNYS